MVLCFCMNTKIVLYHRRKLFYASQWGDCYYSNKPQCAGGHFPQPSQEGGCPWRYVLHPAEGSITLEEISRVLVCKMTFEQHG